MSGVHGWIERGLLCFVCCFELLEVYDVPNALQVLAAVVLLLGMTRPVCTCQG